MPLIKQPTERFKICPGLWIELPIGLDKETKDMRINKLLSRLNQKYYIYNPKAS
jgi:hypothetical protein